MVNGSNDKLDELYVKKIERFDKDITWCKGERKEALIKAFVNGAFAITATTGMILLSNAEYLVDFLKISLRLMGLASFILGGDNVIKATEEITVQNRKIKLLKGKRDNFIKEKNYGNHFLE